MGTVKKTNEVVLTILSRFGLKELGHDILSHFFDPLNYSLSVGKTNNYGLLRKKNTKGMILKQKGTRMAEDGEDWYGLEMTILKNLPIFSKYTNGGTAPLILFRSLQYVKKGFPDLKI